MLQIQCSVTSISKYLEVTVSCMWVCEHLFILLIFIFLFYIMFTLYNCFALYYLYTHTHKTVFDKLKKYIFSLKVGLIFNSFIKLIHCILSLRDLNENYKPWEEHCSGTLLRSSPFYRHLLITNYYTYTHIHTYIKICIHLPTPDPSPPSLWTTSLTSGSVTSAGNGCRTGWLLCRSWITSPVQSRVSMVYYVLLLLRCFFLFSHCTSQGA